MRRLLRRSESVPVIFALSYVLLTAAWMMASPPFSAPDEASHYLRGLSITNGTILGPRLPYRNQALTPAQNAWTARHTRGVRVPARLSPGNVSCVGGRPNVSGCIEPTGVGDYYPLAYLLPAVALHGADNATSGTWLARGASALQMVAFLLLATALLWDGTGWSLVGMMAAVTPMALFIGSAINPNGLEITAALAFAAGLLRLARSPGQSPWWVWAALAVSGAVTVLSWQLGPVFVAVDLVLAGVLLGSAQLRALLKARRGPALLLAGVLAIALGLFLAYGALSGAAYSKFGLEPLGASLHDGARGLGPVLRQAVGVFGLLTIRLPEAAYLVWLALILAVGALALRVARPRYRVVLALAALAAVAFPVVFQAAAYRHTGFSLQGRYVLPILVVVPLVAGEAIRTAARFTRSTRWPVVAVALVVSCFQVIAWWQNARYTAGNHDAWWFPSHTAWNPPLGWWPWIALTFCGAAMLLGAAVLYAARDRRYRLATGGGRSTAEGARRLRPSASPEN